MAPASVSGLKILLIEDDRDDLLFFQEAIRNLSEVSEVTVVRNCDEFFTQFSVNADFDMIFLDINLPGMDGKMCLKEIKSMDRLKDIPVIMFTGSSAQADVDESYASESCATTSA
jgi:CheY-like chemotaxis protein